MSRAETTHTVKQQIQREGELAVASTNRGGYNRRSGQLVPALSVLGAGVGAAIGTMTDSLGTGIWIGGAIGVGLAMLIGVFMNR